MATYLISNAPDINDSQVQTFLSYIGDHGSIARGSRYFVRLASPRVMLGSELSGFENELTYLCESAELPGRSFNTINYRYYGPTKLMPYQPEFNNIQLTFILRNEMQEKQYFDNWFEAISPASSYDMKYKKDYQTTIDIYKMVDYDDGVASATYNVTLEEAFPVTMEGIPLAWGDDTYLKLGITFHYSRYIRRNYDQTAQQFALVNNGAGVTREGGTSLPNILGGDFSKRPSGQGGRDKTGFRN